MKPPGDRLTVCLLTSSAEPSGMGEHMLTLARELEERYRVVLVAPPVMIGKGRSLVRRIRSRHPAPVRDLLTPGAP
ncbi:hypothetical protein [Deinococcus aluminii]|uniref:Glycosyltransferase n=1 Tax=Deinococcus aluminii TaxID=1656885 RepID=A0ABP9XH12_9DEIO